MTYKSKYQLCLAVRMRPGDILPPWCIRTINHDEKHQAAGAASLIIEEWEDNDCKVRN